MNRVIEWRKEHRLSVFVIIVLAITFIMTATSLWIYRNSGAYRFDLSRPGYEDVRGDIQNDVEEVPFSTSGAVDEATIRDFQDRYNKITDRLDKMNDFNQDALTDENLGFSEDENGASEGEL
ncbi:MAG: hypothetical protein LBM09_03165 [Candidatus Nomurabacteria bacterium]|jgi:hypothetical protein|nr:hypothetical protein [Candidatus Nomurabacteria bacterium]